MCLALPARLVQLKGADLAIVDLGGVRKEICIALVPQAREGDYVVGMSVVQPETDLLVLTETGYGKRVALEEFRTMHRGPQGVRLISLEGRKTGNVAAVQQVTDTDEELLLISAGGQVVRTDVKTINRQHAQARGVITMRLNEGDKVVGIAAFRAGLADRDGMGDDEDPGVGGPGQTPPSGGQ